MARVPFSNPNIDRIIDSDYEAYTERLFDEAYGDHGERCKNCEYFENSYKGSPCYCNRVEATDEEIENDDYSAYEIDPEDCCEYWQPGYGYDDEPEEDW